jgi:hypothetical protein
MNCQSLALIQKAPADGMFMRRMCLYLTSQPGCCMRRRTDRWSSRRTGTACCPSPTVSWCLERAFVSCTTGETHTFVTSAAASPVTRPVVKTASCVIRGTCIILCRLRGVL